MADNELIVTISGAALSLLFYENARSVGDEMGFFVGEVLSFVTQNVTDLERHVESVKIHVDIHSIIPCSSVIHIAKENGSVSREKLKAMVKDKGKSIVGWFRFRKNGSLALSLKDKILHKQFLTIFQNERLNENYFVACMLNSSTTIGGGTHKFKHVFLHYTDGSYQPVPLRINNLSHDATRLDGSDYKPTPFKYSNDSDAFKKLLDTLNLNINETSGIKLVQKIQEAAESHLEKLVPRVVDTDREVAALENKLLQVRERLIRDLIQKQTWLSEVSIVDGDYESKKDCEGQQNEKSSRKSSSSGSSRSSDDNTLVPEPSNSIKQKNRHSISPCVNLASNEKLKNPYVKLSYTDIMKKPLDEKRAGSDAGC